jgi:outer membrane protein OmpA-like peptidoglycan-associated protein
MPRIFALLLYSMFVAPLFAQTVAPSTEQMIQQLQRPKTRSLRNLSVEVAPGPASETPVLATVASHPSLSLLVQFDFNSSRVRLESQQALINLSQALLSEALLPSSFAVEGHTDAKGGADYNQKLSLLRAQAVRDFLVTQGVAETRLIASGKGASELATAATPFASVNRRVRIVNLD